MKKKSKIEINSISEITKLWRIHHGNIYHYRYYGIVIFFVVQLTDTSDAEVFNYNYKGISSFWK